MHLHYNRMLPLAGTLILAGALGAVPAFEKTEGVHADSDFTETETSLTGLMLHQAGTTVRFHFALSAHDYNGATAWSSSDSFAVADYKLANYIYVNDETTPLSYQGSGFYNTNGTGTMCIIADGADCSSWTKVTVKAGAQFPSYTYTKDTTTTKACYVLPEDVVFTFSSTKADDANMHDYVPNYTFETEDLKVTGLYLQSVGNMVRMHFYVDHNDWSSSITVNDWWTYPINSSKLAEMSAGSPSLIEVNGTQNWTDGQVFYSSVGDGSLCYFSKDLGQENAADTFNTVKIPKGFLIPKLAFVGAGSIAPTTTKHVAYKVSEDYIWRRRCDVTFDSNGGSAVDSQSVGYGLPITKPADPTKASTAQYSYAFAGWYNGDTLWDFSTTVTGPVTLTAHWTETVNQYTATFDLNGGTSEAIASQTLDYGAKVTKPADPTRDATAQYTYTFDGWYNGDAKWDFTNNTITGALTLQAHWTETVNNYTVTFNSDGGSAVDSQTIAYGSKITKPTEPTKEGTDQYRYLFDGWYNGDTKWNFENDTITGNVTLKAHWIQTTNQYTVTFNSDGGSEVESLHVEYGHTVTKPTDPAKAATAQYSYTFAGWYNGDEAWDFENDTITGDVTLTAHWTETVNQYTVTFDANGGSAVESQSIDYGAKVTKPADPTKEPTAQYSYTFAGWFNGETAWNFENDTITGNVTLTAHWTEVTNQYTATFDLNGGSSEAIAAQTLDYGAKVTKPADPSKAATAQYSYTFAGWYNGDDLWDFENDTITGNVTLTAHWTETVNQYTVTFDSDGGSSVASLQVAYGGKIAKPADPVKAADAQYTYVFASWYNGDKAWDFDNDVVVGNVTLKAHWTATVNQYTVSFDSDGGSEVASQTIGYGSKATKPADPTKEGYTFAGWFDANGNAVNFDEAITGNTVYVAHWNPIAKPEEPAKKGLSGGAIAGIVIGSVVVVGGIVTLVIFLLRKKHGVK